MTNDQTAQDALCLKVSVGYAMALMRWEQVEAFVEVTGESYNAVSRLNAAIYACSTVQRASLDIQSKSFLLKNIVMCSQLSHTNYWLYFICGDKITNY